MNEAFGGQLRRELVQLIDRPELLRTRAYSTGSQRLSSDSIGRFNDNHLTVSKAVLQEAGYTVA